MNVLIAYGSRHGATAEIAEAIGERLGARGIDCDVVEASQVEYPITADAVVVGSSLYTGRWTGPCIKVVKKLAKQEYRKPVWLFHSGPLGEEGADERQAFPKKVTEFGVALDIRDWRTFAGKLDPDDAGFIGKSMAKQGMGGDWRNWDDIAEWSEGIADILTGVEAA